MRSCSLLLLLDVLFLTPTLQLENPKNYVTVQCSQGAVQGRSIDLGSDENNLYSGSANVYSGIPYCQPPVGDLRFKAPQEISSFNSSLHDATYFRPKCPQLNAGGPTNEDCLYLNIYTPMANNATANLSVLVLIDGGNGFSNGGCDESQVKGIVSNLVRRQIIVVTLQYRIGALGFFTTYTNTVQSNLGMLDQVQALRWIKSEIVHFGGNPNRITVSGQDDGACAVSAHCISPMSQNLFNQAIVQSGSVYSCYNPTPAVPTNPDVQVTTPRPTSTTSYGNAGLEQTSTSSYGNVMYDDPNQQLAATLCNVSSEQWNSGKTEDIEKCLKNYTVDFFVNSQPGGPTATWLIVRDTSFLPDSIDNLSTRRPNIPIIIGTVQDENADYAFKLINTGKGNDPNNLENWIFDFAKRNKLNDTQTKQVSDIIRNGYGIGDENEQQIYRDVANNNQSGQYQQAYQNQQGINQQNQGTQNFQTNQQIQYQQGGNQQNQNNQGNQQNQNYQMNQGTQQSQYQQGGNQQNQNNQGNQQNQNQNQNYQTNQGTQQIQYPQGGNQQNQNNQGNQQNQNYQMNQGTQQNQYQQGGNQQNQNNQGNQQNQNYRTNQGTQQSQYQQGGNQQNQNNQGNQQNQNYRTNQGTQQSQYQQGGNQEYQNQNQRSQQQQGNNNQYSVQHDQSSVSDFSQLRTLTQIVSDQAVSLSTTQIQSFLQNGDRHVRIYQFTHVSDIGRNGVPNTGNTWKPVFKGQDMYFITMSETIWSNSTYTNADRQVADQMGQRWTDFVKTGQVQDWEPTNSQDYNYCSLAQNPTQESSYASSARKIFQDQVNPIVETAHDTYAQQNNLGAAKAPATVQYTNDNGRQNFHITFQIHG